MPESHLARADYRVQATTRPEALRLVEKYHYARGGPNTGVFFHGLFHRDDDQLLGVAWWLPPTKVAAQTVSEDWRSVLGLTRLAIDPAVPTNGASYLLGRSIRLIRHDSRWKHLVTYADEAQGHTGQIYLATNWSFVGWTRGHDLWVDGTGRQVAVKSASRTRTNAEMLALGHRRIGKSRKRKFVMHLGGDDA